MRYPLDEHICRVVAVVHALDLNYVKLTGIVTTSNHEFQPYVNPNFDLQLHRLPDNYTFIVLHDSMYSSQGWCLTTDPTL